MSRPQWLTFAAIAGLLLAGSVFFARGPVLAQSATPTPQAEEESVAEESVTEETDPEETTSAEPETEEPETEDVAPEAFLSLDLAAGFPLDPFLVSVNGGGELAAAELAAGCTGYINRAPTITLDWEGQADFVETFFYSDSDPVLVVQTPSGDYLCADDANDLLLDPVVEMTAPATGRYNIWVGSYSPEQLIPGLLVITTRPEINVGTFDLAALITRPAIPEDVLEHEEVAPGRLRLDGVTGKVMTRADAEAVLAREEIVDGVKEAITSAGTVPAFELPVDVGLCTGFIGAEPDFSFALEAEGNQLRVYFEGDRDSTLVVELPDGSILCNDDAVIGDNLNPLISIAAPASGQYSVFVGRIDQDAPVTGNLIVVESDTQLPTDLDPDSE